MFFFLFIIHILIQPAYALDLSGTPDTPVLTATPISLPTITPPLSVSVLPTPNVTQSVPPLSIMPQDTPTSVPLVPPTALVTPVPMVSILPTPLPSVTPRENSSLKTVGMVTPTRVLSHQPTVTPIPAAAVNLIKPTPILPKIIDSVQSVLAPDITFPPSFLKFEKDNGNFYASDHLSPSQIRWIMATSLFLLLGGLTLLLWDRLSLPVANVHYDQAEKGFDSMVEGEVVSL